MARAAPGWAKLTRYALEDFATTCVALPDGVVRLPLDLVPAEWLPPALHMLELDPDGVGRPHYVESRARPARVPLLNGRALSFRSTPRLVHGDCVSFGEPVATTLLDAPEARHPGLEAALGRGDGRSVYADWLLERGDPFGEALARAGAGGEPPEWVLHETRLPLLVVDASWRRGFADELEVALNDPATFPAGLLRVLHARAMLAVRTLTVWVDGARFVQAPLATSLAAHLPAGLERFELVLGQEEPPEAQAVAALEAAARARCPGLAAGPVVRIDPTRAVPNMELMLLNLRSRLPLSPDSGSGSG